MNEELSKMPTLEQLIVANRIDNQQMLQMLGLHADVFIPKQQNTKETKSKKKMNKDINWGPDMVAEEDSDKVDTPVRENSSAATRKSNKSFAPPTKPGSSTNNSTNPAPSPTISLPATAASVPITKSAKCCIRKKAAQITSPASETDKPPSSSNIDTDPKSQQNHPTWKNTLGSESGKTPEAATVPPTCVQPFTGFTALQIEAARQRSIEAQNRKDAIIRLMQAKLFNRENLAIIEPVDCDKCKDYEGHRICPIHYDASGHLNMAQLDNRLQGYNAVKSLPEGVLVKESPIPGAGRSVFTEQFTTLRKDMIYGPYEGVRVYNEREAHQSGYCWQIYYKHKISHWIDARQVRRSNWLRYINCAATMDQQNVCAYQVGQNIYYRTVVDIGPDTELLVWYGDDYARELGLHSMAFMASINSSTINGVDLACWDCQLEFRCRQLLNQHTFTAHDTVNSNIVPVVGKTRCVTNTVATRQVRGSVLKSGAVACKSRVAGPTCSAISDVVVSADSTELGTSNDKLHVSSAAGTNDCFGARMTDSAVNKCQVTAGSGDAGVSSAGVQSRADMSRVVVVTDDGRRFQCSTCCKLFKTRAQLIQHTRIHTGERPFECTACGQRFTQHSSLTEHSRRHAGEKRFECTVCGQRFTLKGDLTRHSLIHTGEKPFECTACGQRFTQHSNLTKHSLIHSGKKPFECTTCGRKFTKNSNLTKHSRSHTGEKPFECTICGQRFTQKGNLARHSLIHSGEKPFECTACGQRFTQHSNLTKHSRSHTGEKPFECTICGQRFTQNSYLTKHTRIHTVMRPFECATCGQKFTMKSHFIQHSLIHAGEKPFECTTCGQKFTLKGNLARHSLIHTGEKPFECTT